MNQGALPDVSVKMSIVLKPTSIEPSLRIRGLGAFQQCEAAFSLQLKHRCWPKNCTLSVISIYTVLRSMISLVWPIGSLMP